MFSSKKSKANPMHNKRSKFAKTLAILVAFIMTLTMMPMIASAASEDGIAQVSCGSCHTGILKTDGTLWMTGANDKGELGDGTTENKYTPVKVMENVQQVSCDNMQTGILKTDGTLWMTGYNDIGQLGDGTTEDIYTPVKVMENVQQVSCGCLHTGILKTDGTLWMMGNNGCGNLGDGTTENKSTPVKVMEGVQQVSCGGSHTGILKTDGTLWMTGYNGYGQLGDETWEDKSTPVKVMENVQQVSCGDNFTGILKTDGTLWMTGHNAYGQFGNGTTADEYMPVKVMENVQQVSCGDEHTGILKTDGTLWMAGCNEYGQLGVGTWEDKSTPVKVMENVQQVSCGKWHTGILKTDSTLWMAGYNGSGELGDGTTENKSTPVKITLQGADSAGDDESDENQKTVTLSQSSSYLAVGKTLILKATGPSDIAYKTSKKTIATVNSSGKVTAKKPGTATITAYSKSNSTNKAVCKITVKYKLTYNMNGGTNSSKNPRWYTGTVKLKSPKARKGYDFKGWYTDAKFKKKVTSVKDANKTLYAKWKVHGYYIIFKKNGGTGSAYSQAARYDKEFTLPACKYTRKGYSFSGWNTKVNGSGKTYADKAKFKNVTSVDNKRIPFYAQWKIIKYSINYKGLPKGTINKNKTSYTINTSTFTLKNASCAGYDFGGWYADSKKTKTITKIKKGCTGKKTIYSKWTPHKYTIKFNANGGTGTMRSMSSCKYGTEYKLTANGFSKKEYVFNCWNTKADGSGTKYKNGVKVSNLVTKNGGSITLYAQWKPAYIPRDTLEGLNQDCLDRAVTILDSSLPNCTTYALARALEIMHYDSASAPNYIPPFIVPGHSNAVYFWENNLNSANPYPTGSTPKVGAIAVWSNGGAGHVAIVEHIEKGVVYYSHSNYGGFGWEPSVPYPGSVNTSSFHCEAKEVNGETKWGYDLTLLGYIYLTD